MGMFRDAYENLLDNILDNQDNEIPIKYNTNILDYLNEIKNDYNLVYFFDILSNEMEKIRRFILLHKFHIKPIKDIEIPLFYYETDIDNKIAPLWVKERHSRITSTMHMTEVFNRIEPIFSSIVDELQEYYPDEEPNDETSDDDETEMSFSEFMTYFIDILSEEYDIIDGPSLIKFIVTNFQDVIIPLGSNMISMLKPTLVQVGRLHLSYQMKYSSMDITTVGGCISSLSQDFKVLDPAFSIVWCSSCLRNPQSFIAIGQLDPPIAICPTCNNKMKSGTFYYLFPPLLGFFEDSEGLIGYLTYWSLASSGVQWAPGVYLKKKKKDTEKDAVFKKNEMDGYGIVEVKTHVIDISPRGLEDKVRQDLNQILNHYDMYNKRGIPIDYFCYISNLPNDARDVCNLLLNKEQKYSKLKKILRIYLPENYHEFTNLIRETI